MTSEVLRHDEPILAIDVGATNIKFSHVNVEGQLQCAVRRRATPYPCTPARLVEFLSERIAQSAARRVSVGFPGEFEGGRVIRPGNLSRPGGVDTEVDPALEQRWRGFALQDELTEVSGRDVRVVNDAALAALGCVTAQGRELVLTLGTGLGAAFAVDGELQRIRDVGAEVFRFGRTYDQTLGERARARGPELWVATLAEVVAGFVEEFRATTVHLAGGNSRRVSPAIFEHTQYRLVIEGNEASMRGAAKLFSDRAI